jgi:hypothetical protein
MARISNPETIRERQRVRGAILEMRRSLELLDSDVARDYRTISVGRAAALAIMASDLVQQIRHYASLPATEESSDGTERDRVPRPGQRSAHPP